MSHYFSNSRVDKAVVLRREWSAANDKRIDLKFLFYLLYLVQEPLNLVTQITVLQKK